MRSLLLAAVLTLAIPSWSLAQTPAAPGATPSKAAPAAKPKREPTAGQLAARERQKRCGAEWREAKGKGQTAGMRWPQYWSKCNARLKGGGQA